MNYFIFIQNNVDAKYSLERAGYNWLAPAHKAIIVIFFFANKIYEMTVTVNLPGFHNGPIKNRD